MKRLLMIGGILAVLGVLTLGVVMAQTEDPPTPFCPFCGEGEQAEQGSGWMSDYMHTGLASALGISEETFEARIAAGESFYEIAADLGFEQAEIRDLFLQARLDALDLAYADGTLTEDQYTFMKDRMESGFGPGMHGGMPGGGGGFRQFGGPGKGNGGGFGGGCPHLNETTQPGS
jgi:hypothetical protein